jgi:hypothetical protein
MSFLGKLMFWKKDDFGGLGKDLNLGNDFSGNNFNNNDFDQNKFGSDAVLQGDQLGLGASSTGMPQDSWQNQQSPDYGMQTTKGNYPAGQQSRPNHPGPGYEKAELIHEQQQQQQQSFNTSSYTAQKEFEVVSAKLDALKAGLDAMNQRLATIEREVRHKKW